MKKKAFLYQKLYDDIRQKIEHGEYKSGQLLPPERELGEAYGVERTTVRRALQMLTDDQLVSKLPGKGTVISAEGTLPHEDIKYDGGDNSGSPMRTIGFFIPQNKKIANKIMFPTYTSLLFLTQQECSERNMRLIYSALDEQKELDEYLGAMHFDGIIFVSTVPEHHLLRARELGIPVVLLNNHNPLITSICTDNFEGGSNVARYLANLGHTNILLIAGNTSSLNCRERVQGFIDEMHEMGLSVDQRVYGGSSWSFESGYHETKRALDELKSPPTAIFTCGDRLAVGALKALAEHGLEVPGDVSVVGYDNSEQAMYANPKLTSVDTNLKTLAIVSIRFLLDIAANPPLANVPLKIMVPPTLVEHNSTRAII